MQYTLGVALLMLSSGEASSMWRESEPDRVISLSPKGPVAGNGEESVPYLASEEEESAFDWLCNN
ncbi:TPA: hypothetical protein ACX4AK_000129 [Klebsiella pneumoniae]